MIEWLLGARELEVYWKAKRMVDVVNTDGFRVGQMVEVVNSYRSTKYKGRPTYRPSDHVGKIGIVVVAVGPIVQVVFGSLWADPLNINTFGNKQVTD